MKKFRKRRRKPEFFRHKTIVFEIISAPTKLIDKGFSFYRNCVVVALVEQVVKPNICFIN